MKILHILFSLSSGGAEKFVVDLTEELSNRSEVFLVTISNKHNELEQFFLSKISHDVKHINIQHKKGLNLKSFFIIFQLIKKIEPNVVNVHLNTIVYVYIPSIIFKSKVNFFHTLHSQAEKTIGFNWQKSINKFFYSNSLIKPIAISSQCKKSFTEFYGLENAILIENGCRTSDKSNNYEFVKEELESLKSHKDDLIFLHVARFSPSKNQQLLLEVFKKLISENEHIILVVIGSGFDSLNSSDFVTGRKDGIYFLGTRKNLTDYLIASDAFCLTSIWEGLPISLIEALSCGTTPICTPAGGIIDVISSDGLGIISDDFSHDAYYIAIKRFLNEKEKFCATTLKKHFREHYSIEKCATKYINNYTRF